MNLYLFWTSEIFIISHVSVSLWPKHTILHEKSKINVSYQLFDWIAHYVMWTCFNVFIWGPKSFFFHPAWKHTKKVAKKQLPGVNNNILSYEILFFSFPKCKFCQSEMLHHFTTSSATHVQPTAREVKVPPHWGCFWRWFCVSVLLGLTAEEGFQCLNHGPANRVVIGGLWLRPAGYWRRVRRPGCG